MRGLSQRGLPPAAEPGRRRRGPVCKAGANPSETRYGPKGHRALHRCSPSPPPQRPQPTEPSPRPMPAANATNCPDTAPPPQQPTQEQPLTSLPPTHAHTRSTPTPHLGLAARHHGRHRRAVADGERHGVPRHGQRAPRGQRHPGPGRGGARGSGGGGGGRGRLQREDAERARLRGAGRSLQLLRLRGVGRG